MKLLADYCLFWLWLWLCFWSGVGYFLPHFISFPFTLHQSQASLISGFTHLRLHSFHTSLISHFTHFTLHTFHTSLISGFTHFILHSFHSSLISPSIHLTLHNLPALTTSFHGSQVTGDRPPSTARVTSIKFQ